MVLRPEMKSTSPSVGMSKGSQASWVGETWTLGFMGRKFDSVSGLSGRSVCSVGSESLVLWDKGRGWCMGESYKAFMCNGRSNAVEPGVSVTGSGGDEGGSGHLFGVEAEADAARGVLTLGDCAGDRF